MIYYFSGMGNSAYVAEALGRELGEKTVKIVDVKGEEAQFEGDSLGLVFPIYSWGVPPIMLEFISGLDERFIEKVRRGAYPVWMVCTFGDEIGNAAEMLRDTLSRRRLELKGAWNIQMPNTYVILPGFDVDSVAVERKKLEDAEEYLPKVARKIKAGEWEWKLKKGAFPWILTGLIYPGFVKWGINCKKWHFTEACVKCGKCVRSCPVKNIVMEEQGPVWGSNCISCLACFHHCPYHAVEYGKITKKKGQYVCPLKIK